MATYVLVAGAWLGGWAWQRVAAPLRAKGHLVYPLSLTGLGERVHLARPEVDLETHITDVVNLLRSEDLSDVSLAGHSYAGAVVAGVADRVPERLAAVVYVDSAPLANGQALADLFGANGLAALQQVVDQQGDGWQLPFPGSAHLGEVASIAGLDADALALLDERAAPQPWGTYTQPLRLYQTGDVPYRRIVVACDDVRDMAAFGVPAIAEMMRPPWEYHELATGHWPMLSAPDELAAVLDHVASG